MNTCEQIVFSNKAYNAIIRESFAKDPVETGGVLLGHMTDVGVWIIMEVIPPGPGSIFEYAYCLFDEPFVQYLRDSVANQYLIPLSVLGIWHRHPGGFNEFSLTDDEANRTYASENYAGALSGLVNINPNFKLTLYYLNNNEGNTASGRPKYHKKDFLVGDDLIPEIYFKYKYYNGEEDENSLNPPLPSHRNIIKEGSLAYNQDKPKPDAQVDNSNSDKSKKISIKFANNKTNKTNKPSLVSDIEAVLKKKWIIVIVTVICTLMTVMCIRYAYNKIICSNQREVIQQEQSYDNPKEPKKNGYNEF